MQLTGAGGNKGNAESPMEPVVFVCPLFRDGWSCVGLNCARQVHRLDPPRLKLCHQYFYPQKTLLLVEAWVMVVSGRACRQWGWVRAQNSRALVDLGWAQGLEEGVEEELNGTHWASAVCGVDAGGRPSSVVQAPLLKPSVNILRGGIDRRGVIPRVEEVAVEASAGARVVHPGFFKTATRR